MCYQHHISTENRLMHKKGSSSNGVEKLIKVLESCLASNFSTYRLSLHLEAVLKRSLPGKVPKKMKVFEEDIHC